MIGGFQADGRGNLLRGQDHANFAGNPLDRTFFGTIDVDPTFGNPYNDIGSYLMMKGQIDEAIPWLERALQAPRYESYCYPHMNLGRAYESKHDWLRAKDEYRKALAENKDYTPAAQALARIRGFLN